MSKRLVIYLMAGPETQKGSQAAEAGGADIVEIGFPFWDPLADGPVIRRAAERSLAAGMRTAACLENLRAIRERVSVPLVPMTYASLLEAYGWERFADDARAAGAESLIVADLPVDVRPEARARAARRADVDRRADCARRAAHGRLALSRHRGGHDRCADGAVAGPRAARRARAPRADGRPAIRGIRDLDARAGSCSRISPTVWSSGRRRSSPRRKGPRARALRRCELRTALA